MMGKSIDRIVDDYIPHNIQRKYLLLSFLAWIIVSYGVLLGAFTLGEVSSQFSGGYMLQAFLKSSVFIGMLTGAFISGFISDIFGRKIAMNIYLTSSVIFTFLNGFSSSTVNFTLFRLLSGFGYGGLLPSVNTYLSETVSIKIRGRYLVLLESMWAIGSMTVGVVDLTIGRNSWRWDYWMMGIAIIFLVPFMRIPESPRFVFMKNGKEALERSLNVKIEDEIEEIERKKVPVIELLRGEYLRRTLMIWFVWFTLSIVYYGIFLWLPKIFSAKGVVGGEVWLTFLMMAFQLPGYYLAAYLIEKIGRVPSLLLFLFGTGVTSLGFALAQSFPVYIVMAFLTSVFCLGAWGIVYAYTPELYPTSFRTTGNGTAGTITRIAGIIAPYIPVAFKHTVHSLTFFSALLFLSGFMVSILGVETRNREIG